MFAVNHTPLTPLAFLERSASVFPEKAAIRYGGRTVTYREFEEHAHRLASALTASGVSPGDRVGYLCPNIPPMLVAHFGVALSGAVLVAINTRLSPDEILYICNHSGAKLLVVDSELLQVIEPIAGDLETVREIVRYVDGVGVAQPTPGGIETLDYDEFLARGTDARVANPVTDEEATISINYTSGTTGRPKGVMYTHRGGHLNALAEVIHANLRPDSHYLWTLPMFHCNGWCFTWGVTAIGATHVCLRAVVPDVIWDLVDSERITHLNGAPTVLITMLADPAAPQAAPERPLLVTTAGAPPSPTLIGQMHAIGATVNHVYGLTETYGPMTVCEVQPAWRDADPVARARLQARQGVAYLGADLVRVITEPSPGVLEDVARDGETMGEVVMRGNQVMAGYFEQPEATADAFRGGWFHSGDLVVWHPDGYIELRDRKKDIIISGGENISTIEVEQAIAAHPAVLECAVVAVPHEKWGEVPKGFVVLREHAIATADEIIAFTRERLAHFKCPKEIEFGPLPKTSTGKIQKYVLRDKEWAGRETRIN